MNRKLKVLLVEDSEDDALLTLRVIRKGGFNVFFERVETSQSMREALEKQGWDIVLSDYRLPKFSSLEALEIIHETSLYLPFIILSGYIDEAAAVDAIKAGAQKCISKDNLTQLVPAIERVLCEAKARKESYAGDKEFEKARGESNNTEGH